MTEISSIFSVELRLYFLRKLHVEKLHQLSKYSYFLAVITAFVEWVGGLKYYLIQKQKGKAGSLDNHNFSFCKHKSCS